MKQKTILVPFSGGLDSTYLVWKLLKEGHKVYTVYFKLLNNDSKIKMEQFSRDLLIKKFDKEFPSLHHDTCVDFECRIHNHKVGYTMAQVPIWILGSFFSCSNTIDEISIAYVMNDDAISYLSEIRKLYNSYKFLAHHKLPVLNFPLSKIKKQEILHNLPQEYKDLTVSCEAPYFLKWKNKKVVEYSFCGSCVPCERAKKTYSSYETTYPDRKTFKSFLKNGEWTTPITIPDDRKAELVKEVDEVLPKGITKIKPGKKRGISEKIDKPMTGKEWLQMEAYNKKQIKLQEAIDTVKKINKNGR
jgi:7-cyano-7-deazaguanine synthase in queuosine biosynthesis